jgi:hypothetical protein
MTREKDMLRSTLVAAEGRVQRGWVKPSVIRLNAGAAEVGTRSTPDGPLSSTS